ncbi:hypothetical protein INN71_08790 [Nocardioides sp. ChNu-153]|uniref:hypothetical protein n=1 Tax=Nocardioides sp. ChNu-153 TaxID=2779364 RepID=UPI00264E5494|nr:hypothetical protein [Nocardioides sp. ChNu-153]MDN7121485.1 hypothetical protein [Nocardioides sp. ChNu-153]
MGNGAWSDESYRAAATFRRRSGAADFGYSDDVRRRPASQWRAHPTLDPKDVGVRESRDSVEHPNSTPIAVFFDVTGSMGTVPRQMQAELAKLHGLLQRKGYAEDPQIMFGALGDADTDYVPLQVGQFESDNRMDEQLRSIFLEGNGGGQLSESYELAAYFMARHTATDAWEKRGKKGYLFVIGDEMGKPRLRARYVRDLIGDRLPRDLDSAALWREVQERWEVFFVLPKQTTHFDNPKVNGYWADVLGERLLRLEDPAAVCDLIALTVGLLEDAIDLDEGLEDLREVGSASGPAVGRALATVGARGGSGGAGTTTLPAALACDLDAPDDLA